MKKRIGHANDFVALRNCRDMAIPIFRKLDIQAARRRCMRGRMKNPEVEPIPMLYVSPETLSRLSRADYLRAEMFSGLTRRFTWGKR
ncbi:hypothetical protein ACVBGC_06340 [Burkholderia stagnalis]